MKLLGKLTLFLGGLLTMTTLQACGPADPSVSNRTIEQHNLEKEFQPLFDFLAQEKKDFSDVKSYKSSVYTTDNQTNTEKDYRVSFENLLHSKTGTYTITTNQENKEYPISVDDLGKLTYPSSVPEEFDNTIFTLTLEEGFFQKLPISDYLAKHPKTYLRDISYGIDDSGGYFTSIKEKYGLSSASNISLTVTSSEPKEFDIVIDINDKTKSVHIQNRLEFSRRQND